MKNLKTIAILILVILVLPAQGFAQQSLTEVVFSRSVANSEPANPFEPAAYCEKGPEPSAPLPKVNSATETQIFFWNRVESASEGIIRHTWYQDNNKVAEVDLKVGVSPRWRTWSSKRIVSGMHAGKWKVVISKVEAPNEVLCVAHFIVE